MSKLVIFDCDGVLVDSERLAIKVDVEVLGRLGWSLKGQYQCPILLLSGHALFFPDRGKVGNRK